MVEAARVTQVVAGAVPPPHRRADGAAVDALTALRVVVFICNKGFDVDGRVVVYCKLTFSVQTRNMTCSHEIREAYLVKHL